MLAVGRNAYWLTLIALLLCLSLLFAPLLFLARVSLVLLSPFPLARAARASPLGPAKSPEA